MKAKEPPPFEGKFGIFSPPPNRIRRVSIEKGKSKGHFYGNAVKNLPREIQSSKFKNISKMKSTDFLSKQIENSSSPTKIKKIGLLLKKATINLSDMKNPSFEDPKISKSIEIATAALKNIPFMENNNNKEKNYINDRISTSRFINHTLNENYRLRSGDIAFNNPLSVSSRENIFKSPQLSPVLDGFNKKESANITPPPNLSKYLHCSLSFRPFRMDDEVHSALGQSLNRLAPLIREVEENSETDEKFNFTNLDKSIYELKSDAAEEEIREFQNFPDESNTNRTMEKSWDYKSIMRTDLIDKEEQTNAEIKLQGTNGKDTLNPGKFLIRFGKSDDEAAEKFYDYLFENYKKENYVMMSLVLFIFLYHSYSDYWNRELELFEMDFAFRMGFVGIFIMIMKYLSKLFEKRLLRKGIIAVCLLLNGFIIWPYLMQSKIISLIELSEILLINMFFQNISIILFTDSLFISSFVLGFLFVFKITSILQFLIFLYIILVHLFLLRKNLLREINKNNLNIANMAKKTQQKTLVRNLLPNHITHQFINNPSAKSDLIEEFNNVTILFADIKGFTDFSAHNPAPVVVNMLRDLFTEFDKLCLQNDVYKLYTIGDCYVAMGLIDANERNVEDEAKNVIQFAFDMINQIKSVRKKSPELEMRIGIHIVFFLSIIFYFIYFLLIIKGNIIGGIIGTDIVRYDIYGRDVLIANKMESNGQEGTVVISEKLKELIDLTFPGFYFFEPHCLVKIEALETEINTWKVYQNPIFN